MKVIILSALLLISRLIAMDGMHQQFEERTIRSAQSVQEATENSLMGILDDMLVAAIRASDVTTDSTQRKSANTFFLMLEGYTQAVIAKVVESGSCRVVFDPLKHDLTNVDNAFNTAKYIMSEYELMFPSKVKHIEQLAMNAFSQNVNQASALVQSTQNLANSLSEALMKIREAVIKASSATCDDTERAKLQDLANAHRDEMAMTTEARFCDINTICNGGDKIDFMIRSGFGDNAFEKLPLSWDSSSIVQLSLANVNLRSPTERTSTLMNLGLANDRIEGVKAALNAYGCILNNKREYLNSMVFLLRK